MTAAVRSSRWTPTIEVRKLRKATILALAMAAMLLAPAFSQSVWAGATVQEPQLKVSGNVTKDIIDPSNIWLYTDSDGQNQTLSYQRDGNITFSTYDLELQHAFVNESVANAGTYVTNSRFTVSQKLLLRDSSNIKYMLLTLDYSASGLASASGTGGYIYFDVDEDISKLDYFMYAAKLVDDSVTNNTDFQFSIMIVAIDEGGEDHYILFRAKNTTAAASVVVSDVLEDSDSANDDLIIYDNVTSLIHKGSIVVYSYKWLDLALQKLNVNLVKISRIYLGVHLVAGNDVGTIKIAYRFATFSTIEPKINDQTLNRTITLNVNSDTISSTVPISKIADATVPFEYTVSPDKYSSSSNYTIVYDYDIMLPDATELSFSGVKANFTMGSGSIKEFWISGTDYNSTYSSLKSGESAILLTDPTPGQLYNIKVKIAYTAEQWRKLTAVGFVWTDPSTWSVAFWGLIATILSALGIGAGYALRRQEKAQEVAFNKRH